jgi:hypothetical protein
MGERGKSVGGRLPPLGRSRGPVASPRERRVQASRNESAMAAVAHKSLPTSNLPRRGHHWCSSSSFRTLGRMRW